MVHFEWLLVFFFLLLLIRSLYYMCIKNKNEWLNTTNFHVIKIVFISSTWHIYRKYIHNVYHTYTYMWRMNKYICFEIKEKAEKVWFCKIIIILWKCVFGADIHSKKENTKKIQLQEVQSYNNWHASFTACIAGEYDSTLSHLWNV